MSAAHDLVIRGGEVIDGSGASARRADVAIDGSQISAVGDVAARGEREIDASGLLVTPGWVDVHTHYDGQVTWDPQLTPSSWHGVTTVVMGNCGVGFAPVAPDRRDYLIALMEGVEDIPGTALSEGIQWEWESFPEYLDALSRREFAIDVGAQLPHAALRFYVMGERGADHAEQPTPSEIDQMAGLAREAIEAGAIGFTTSRTVNHKSSDGRHTPSLTASADELLGIACGVGAAGRGVLEVVADFVDLESEFALLREMVERSGRPMSISVLQTPDRPDQWRELLGLIQRAAEAGLPMRGQVAARGVGLCLGLQATMNPFSGHPSFAALADLSHEDRVERLSEPAFQRRLLAEAMPAQLAGFLGDFSQIYDLGSKPDYEPAPSQSLAAQAEQLGTSPEALCLEKMLEADGTRLLYRPVMNYAEGNLDAVRAMIEHPHTVPGLGDAGAHCGMICDGSFPTYWLSHWGRDRQRGERLPVAALVKSHTADNAALVGLHDRGRVAPGLRADLNLIDFETLGVAAPSIAYDLPAGGKRLVQRAHGYRATFVAGQQTALDGASTGALPGRLIRTQA